jgi:hypothetical protein
MRIHLLHTLKHRVSGARDAARRGRRGNTALCAIAAALLALVGEVGAQDLSLTLSSPRWPVNASGYRPDGADLSISPGIAVGLSPRVELDIGAAIGIIPEPLGDIRIAASLAYSFCSARFLSAEAATAHINALIGAGFATGFHGLAGSAPSAVPTASYHVFLEFTPLAVGSLFYGKRNRIGTFGLQYDFKAKELSYFFDLISIDLRLAPPPKVR